MNQEFKDFLLEETKKWPEGNKTLVLDALKNRPDKLKAFIMSSFDDWAGAYAMKSRKVLHVRYEEDSNDLMEAWRELFKDELAALA